MFDLILARLVILRADTHTRGAPTDPRGLVGGSALLGLDFVIYSLVLLGLGFLIYNYHRYAKVLLSYPPELVRGLLNSCRQVSETATSSIHPSIIRQVVFIAFHTHGVIRLHRQNIYHKHPRDGHERRWLAEVTPRAWLSCDWTTHGVKPRRIIRFTGGYTSWHR